MPYPTFYHNPPPPMPVYSPVHIQETSNNGFQVKMFGSEKTETDTSLLVSIPKPLTDDKQLIVSVPLAKIVDCGARFSNIPKRLGTSSAEQDLNESQASEHLDGPHTTLPPFTLQDSMPEPNVKGPVQRKILLPNPPPHFRLTPDELKRMETTQHEYWEAPGISGPLGNPLGPPRGPMWRPPPNVRYHAPPPRKQYFRPAGPRSFPPRPPPPNHHWNQPPQWHPTGMELGPGNITSRPVGMEPRPSGMEHKQPGMEPRQPGGVEHRPSGMEPRQSRPEPSNFSTSRFGGNDARPGGTDPRQTTNDPRYAGQDPRGSSSLTSQRSANWGPHSSHFDAHVPPFQSGPTYSGPSSLSPPFQAGMSPPQTIPTNRPSPVWSNNELLEKSSPVWRLGTEDSSASQPVWCSSPDHSPLYKGGVEPNVNRRVDPRKKYSHLKIKTKGQEESPQQLKKESNNDKPVAGFKIPKLLKDSIGLDKPLDPLELFGASELGSQPYGEITIGNYTSPFSQHSVSDVVNNGHNGDKSDACREDKLDQFKVGESTNRTSLSSTYLDNPKPAQVPSYLAQIDLGSGTSDLRIESAFGSLLDKDRSPEEEDSKDEVQQSHARKLPSVFGFGV